MFLEKTVLNSYCKTYVPSFKYLSFTRQSLHKHYRKRDEDCEVYLTPSYGVYIFQLVCYARVCSDVLDFNKRKLWITVNYQVKDFVTTNYWKSLNSSIDTKIRLFGCTCRKLITKANHPNFYGDVAWFTDPVNFDTILVTDYYIVFWYRYVHLRSYNLSIPIFWQ